MTCRIKILEVIWSSYPLLTEEEPEAQRRSYLPVQLPFNRVRTTILGLIVLCVPPWDMSKTVAAGFLWKSKEENMHLLRLKQVVLVLSVGGLNME